MNNRFKNLKFNYYLFALILLESIYIVQVYFPLYGNQGIIASAIYALIAFAHVKYPSKQLANLILIISLAIAIPRILVMIENRIEDRRISIIQSIDEQLGNLDKPHEQTQHDCKLIPYWDAEKISLCQKNNLIIQTKYNEQLEQYQHAKKELYQSRDATKQSIQLTLADYGSLVMFVVLSIALPSVIYFILLQTSPMPQSIDIPIVIADRKQTTPDEIIKDALELYKSGMKVNDILIKLNGRISKSTIYKYINKSNV